MTQREDSDSIAEALAVWRRWNPGFSEKPLFVIDHSMAEMRAIRSVWPGTDIFLSFQLLKCYVLTQL
jgi:hypothetical protein